MKKKSFYGTIALTISIVLISFSFDPPESDLSKHPRKIVVFKKWFHSQANQDTLLRIFGAVKIKHLSVINSMAAFLPRHAEKALRKRDEILRIDEDLIIFAIGKTGDKKPKPQPPEELPWGIDRINADGVWAFTRGHGIKVAILDTGIDLEHLDLQDNIKGNVNMIKPRKSGKDNNGHGTHVAGIVAAIDNDIGVIGTGPEVSLYVVKVLDNQGRGWLSDLIDGLNWCIYNDIQVVNMSFGSLTDNESFHEAIIVAHQAGITLVASAGNNGETGGAIEYPAKYPETIAVSAIDQFNQLASFSSYGPEIDLTAPGVDIYSTYKKGSYETMEGTSMSAPHVTGTVALILTTTPQVSYDLDNDNLWNPEEIRLKLKTAAEDLFLSTHEQGAGLVRADLAVF